MISPKKNRLVSINVLAIFLFCTSFLCPTMPGSQIGDKAMNFKLKNIDGKMISLNDNASAKGYILVFTCNHCPFAKAYEDRIITLHNQFAAKGYPVIAINPNDKNIEPEDSYEEMVKRAAEHHYHFPYLYDETQEIATAYGAARTPHVFVLQKMGKDFIIKYIGAIDDNADEPASVTKHYVSDAVNSLLEGKEVAVKSTKAIGCTIKWKKN